MTKNNTINFEIVKHYGVLSEKQSPKSVWKKELNLVKWNDGDAKFDIREWDENHERMSKGIVLTEDEFRQLAVIISEMQR